MERGLYAAATGMNIADQWISTISNNLANASTTAYKRDVLAFNEAYERQLTSEDGSKVGNLGVGPEAYRVITVWEHGAVTPTGNPFDISIGSNRALFKVSTPDGEAYSRNGALSVSPDNQLCTSTGALVLGTDGSPIRITAGQLAIDRNGTVSIDGKTVGQIGFYAGTFSKIGDGNYSSTDAAPVAATEAGVQQGFIEGSNVNVVEEMIAMVKLNRAFELAQKSAQSQDDSTQRLIGILQGR